MHVKYSEQHQKYSAFSIRELASGFSVEVLREFKPPNRLL